MENLEAKLKLAEERFQDEMDSIRNTAERNGANKLLLHLLKSVRDLGEPTASWLVAESRAFLDRQPVVKNPATPGFGEVTVYASNGNGAAVPVRKEPR